MTRQYWSEFILPSTTWSLPTPFEHMTDHTITFVGCFTVGVVGVGCLRWCHIRGADAVWQMNVDSSETQTLLQSSTVQWAWLAYPDVSCALWPSGKAYGLIWLFWHLVLSICAWQVSLETLTTADFKLAARRWDEISGFSSAQLYTLSYMLKLVFLKRNFSASDTSWQVCSTPKTRSWAHSTTRRYHGNYSVQARPNQTLATRVAPGLAC